MKTETKTTLLKEESRPALLPKLRFPEFRDAEGWECVTLNRLAVRVKQKNRDEKIVRVLTNSAEFGVVDQRDFFDKDIATQGKLEGYFVVELGSYVYNPRISSTAPVGPISKNKIGTGVMSPLYTVFRFKDDSNDFLEHFFKTAGWHTYMREASSTGARHDRMAISSDDFMAMPLPVSSPAEQQKISECLSSVDELMAAQARKVDALKTHKKGLMQQLFPREGETQPRLRFPEFQNAGEWAMKTMGSIASFSSGGTPSKDNPEYWNGTIPWVSASSMYDLVIEKADHYVTPLAIGNGTRIAKKGSILILVRGSMLFKRVPICVAGIDVTFNQDVKALNLDPSINTGFLLYQLSAFQARLPINETGIGAGKIELDHLKGFELFIPDTLEQQRIATCLSSLDALISAETQKHEALKTHKRGMMQQLFPSPEEVEA
ncbi:MAG: restriction endonuclease subunit S [Verrucomicrobia bacterium]|nr:restriction endonuclease subunit S [Verrucomicrobiota bacterium]